MAKNEPIKRGPGRPPKPPHEVRSITLGSMVTPIEAQAIRSEAARLGLSPSDYIRSILLSHLKRRGMLPGELSVIV